jgi:Bacterial protein of unknown function (DUF916)
MRQCSVGRRHGRSGSAHHRDARVGLLIAPLVALLVTVGGLLTFAAPATAAGNGQFSIEPTSHPGTNPAYARPFFNPQLQPGETATDSVTVVNQTTAPLTLRIYAADALTTRDGGFSIRPNYWPKTNMGVWIHLPVAVVTIPARSGDLIPFSYKVPANVTPGDYSGGIVAEETQGTLTKHGAVRIDELQAVGTAVFGRVAGQLHPRFAVTAVGLNVKSSIASQFGGPVDATVTYSVTNTGNENANPKVKISLSPLFGGGPSHVVQLPQVLPGSTVTFTKTFNGVVPYGDLGATVTATAVGVQATGTASAIVIPWALVIIVILLIALLYVRVVRKRRRRRVTPEGGSGSKPPVTASAGSRTP